MLLDFLLEQFGGSKYCVPPKIENINLSGKFSILILNPHRIQDEALALFAPHFQPSPQIGISNNNILMPSMKREERRDHWIERRFRF